jgi:hypothetical protein
MKILKCGLCPKSKLVVVDMFECIAFAREMYHRNTTDEKTFENYYLRLKGVPVLKLVDNNSRFRQYIKKRLKRENKIATEFVNSVSRKLTHEELVLMCKQKAMILSVTERT